MTFYQQILETHNFKPDTDIKNDRPMSKTQNQD